MTSKIFRRTESTQLFKLFAVLVVASLLFLLAVVAYAEEITYTGKGKDLQDSPAWFFKPCVGLLFPGTMGTPLSSNNKIIINYNPEVPGTENPQIVYGGLSDTGNAAGNSVVLLNGSTGEGISGGYSHYGNVVDNSVTVSRGNAEIIDGGTSYKGDAVGNSVIISGGIVETYVYGGFSHEGRVADNMVTTSGGIIRQYVYGGFSHEGSVTDNRVTVKEGNMGYVYGGSSDNGGVADNSVTISGGSVGVCVYGGWSDYGGATDNSVTISGGSVADSVYGGCSRDGDVSGNKIVISGGAVKETVYGGESSTGAVTGNSVTISGGSVYSDVYGGGIHVSHDGSITGNSVTISGGSVGQKVFGGRIRKGRVTGNTVTVSGGSVADNVYGGYCNQGNATGNTVTISGRPNLTKAFFWGGHIEDSQGDAFTGNTLNLKSSGISAKGVGNFEYYNFYLPQDLTAGGVMLSVADEVNLKGATAAVLLQGSTKLRKGDKVALIHSAAGVSNAPKNKSCKAQQGNMLYEFSIYTNKNNLWAEVTKISSAAK